MSNNKLCYQARSCKMPTKNNPQYLVELPSCAWARRRRLWHGTKFDIGDTDSSTIMQTTQNIKTISQRYNRNRIVQSPLLHNKLKQLALSVFIIFFLIISSHCLYHGENENAHTKQDTTIISNYLSPLEGK